MLARSVDAAKSLRDLARTATRACHAIDVVELTDVHGIVGFRRPQVAVCGARVEGR